MADSGLDRVLHWRRKAYDLTMDDHMGSVLQRAFELCTALMKDEADAVKIGFASEMLDNQRQLIAQGDKRQGISTPLRECVLGLTESLKIVADKQAKKEKLLASLTDKRAFQHRAVDVERVRRTQSADVSSEVSTERQRNTEN